MEIKKFIVLSVILGLATGLFLAINKSGPTEDSWKNTSPSFVSMSDQVLDDLRDSMHAGELAAVDGIVIVKDGYLVFEEYDNGFNPGKVHELQSVTKSITALLVGIAMDKGYIDNLEQPILPYFDDITIENVDERKQAITLEDLLTMRSGFQWNEFSESPDSDLLQEMYSSPSWIKTTLDTNMAYRPGILFQYNTGSTMLLDRIIEKTTGLNSYKFAQEFLFEPLGIRQHFWSKESFYFFGTTNTGGGLYLRPTDLAKIGQLVLNKGNWDGRQIISEEWIEEATTPQVASINLGITKAQYGYLWYVFPKGTLNDSYSVIGCMGAGGQYLFIIPEISIVTVITSNNFEYRLQGLEIAQKILNDYVIKSFEIETQNE